MRLPQLLAIGPELAAYILALPLLCAHGAHAIAQTSVASPNLDLSPLGRVAVAGDFDGISLYTYAGQNENSFTTNGSQALLSRFPNGAFQTLGLADASILAMCPLMSEDGSLQGVVVGGNFTSLGGVEAQSIAFWDPDTSNITALPGLSGAVNALFCDSDSGTVYVGGRFIGGNSTNSITWSKGWTNLPFAGFNGPVSSITKNAAGNIVFAGQFDGLGNATTPQTPDSQIVNLGSGNITSSGTTTTDGFDQPKSIICSTSAQDGSGSTWLLGDSTQGWWQGDYGFGFNPTKIRLYNTLYQGRGSRTFYFEELNSGGILNMTYEDADGTPQSCSERCPLAHNSSAQDFRFSPSVGMSSFRIYITEWYGSGGGLSGIEMFQDDIYSFAVADFNEPKCDDASQGSTSMANPNSTWTRVREPSTIGGSDYLSAYFANASQINPSTNVVFQPDLRQSGNYSINIYTPGCLQDKSCDSRGQVNITGTMTSNTPSFSMTLFQSNNYDKFDQIYYGYVDVDSGSFRPSVTLAPASGQEGALTVVAQRVRFELITSTGGLNGLFEYDPTQGSVSTDFSNSSIDTAGASLESGAIINAVAIYQDTLFAAGNFSGKGISNFMSVDQNASAVSGGGLNGPAAAIFQNGSLLYVGGNFSNSADGSVDGLNNVAVFDASGNKWTALGAGVNHAVTHIVPLQLNVTSTDLEDCIALTGDFTTVNAFSGNSAYTANGFAVWVVGKQNWLHNINGATLTLTGGLTSFTNLSNAELVYGGEIYSQTLGMSGAVELLGSSQPSLQSLGVQINSATASNSSASSRKRALATTGKNATGVYNGLFYDQNGLNITILGGSFSATASNGSTVENLVFINNTDTQSITGPTNLDSDSIIVALATQGTKLFAGGAVRGSGINGLVAYDLATSQYVSPSPPALAGSNVVVNAIAPQPSSSAVYVGGDFDEAGSLPCATLCYYDTSTNQWNLPGNGLSGVISSMFWSANTQLIIAGNLTVSGNATNMVAYDSKQQTFSQFTGASTLPGPITALSSGTDATEFWVAGTATSNHSAYLSRFSGNTWTAASGLGEGTTIRGLTVLSTSSKHDDSALVPSDRLLLISGNINLPDFGNASAVLFNGTTYEPFILTTMEDGSQGSLSGVFVQNVGQLDSTHHHYLALGLVVLVGLAIALGLIFLMVCAGICLERNRRRREGYTRMPAAGVDVRANMERITPSSLLAGLGQQSKAPKL